MPAYFVRVQTKKPFDEIFNLVKEKYANVYFNILDSESEKIGLIIGTKWFFKTNGDVAVTIIIKDKGEKTILDIITYGGREGMFGLSLGVHEDLAGKVLHFLKSKNIDVKVIEKIKYANPEKIHQLQHV